MVSNMQKPSVVIFKLSRWSLNCFSMATVLGVASLPFAPACGQEPAAPATEVSSQPEDSAPASSADQGGAVPGATLNAAVSVSGLEDGQPLSFSFERAPWRDVIKWLADECGLALQYEELPTGSFSYSDAGEFSRQAAIDRVNLFLLPQGYTLVQSGRLLSVINLGDPRSMQQLDALASFTTAEQLAGLPRHEVVKCMFALGELTAQDAVEELSALQLMTTPAVFSKTNQLMITDTVAKLQSVKAILDAFQPQGLDNGTMMKSFALKHAVAEDILLVARPHLGLATGEMIGIDVSLSTDLQGKNIFVTGVEDRVKLVENLVQALDQPAARVSATQDAAELRSHFVKGGNTRMIYDVLQTLLAGESLRLSIDDAASSIVALAPPAIQNEIAQTVSQMQAGDADFEVIPLKSIDPYFAISLLEEMLDLPSSYDDPDDVPADAPKVDADPGNMRLFVRAKPYQIEQIKKIIAGLDSAGSTQAEHIRVLPLTGSGAEDSLKAAAKFWRRENPIVLFPSDECGQPRAAAERVVGQLAGRAQADVPLTARLVSVPTERESKSARFLTDNIRSQAPLIRCQITDRGVILQSEDAQALEEFERHLKAITGPVLTLPAPPTVFYLQYTKPEDALRLLAELLDGGESAMEAQTDTLVNGYVSSRSGSFLGSLVTSRDGTITMMSDSITVVAEPRLNRLIAQGTTQDIQLIEDYLTIIDKDSSIAENRTYGTSHVIELQHTNATEIAAAIREAYAGRITASSAGTAAANARAAGDPAEQRPAPRSNDEGRDQGDRKTASKSGSSQSSRDLEPKMTIAVHQASNSLIVTAPDQLFEEVENLAKLLDTRSEETIEILAPLDAAALQAVLQPENAGSRSSSSSSRDRRSDGSTRSQILDLFKSRGFQN